MSRVSMIVVLAVALMLVMGGAVAAQGESGPDHPLTLTDEWMALNAGDYHWYAFQFDYDKDVDEAIEIKFFTEPAESAALTVRNAEQIKLWQDDGKHEHFGCCTAVDVDKDHNGVKDFARWAGALRESGTYYLVIEHAENMPEAAYYRFDVAGKNVTFLSNGVVPAAVPDTTVAAPAAIAEPMVEAPAMMAGSGPDLALRPTGKWAELAPKAEHWYVFNYDEDEDWTQMPEIRLYASPPEAAELTVRNGDQARLWVLEGENEHFGCCTEKDEDKNSDGKADYMIWSGDLGSSGQYYIVVKHAADSDQPLMYRFVLEGDGISW